MAPINHVESWKCWVNPSELPDLHRTDHRGRRSHAQATVRYSVWEPTRLASDRRRRPLGGRRHGERAQSPCRAVWDLETLREQSTIFVEIGEGERPIHCKPPKSRNFRSQSTHLIQRVVFQSCVPFSANRSSRGCTKPVCFI